MEPRGLSVSSRESDLAVTSEQARTVDGPASEMMTVAAVALATTLAPLNSTMIAVALPHIMEDFHVDVAAAGWLVTAYLIAMAATQPVAGKLGDRFGRRRLMLGGLAAFALASLGAALSLGLLMLLIFRLLQAFSGAITLPNGTALLREVVPAHRRASRFGLVGAAASLAAAIGPPLGGVLVSLAGWRVQFYANLPLVLGALVLGWIAIPRTQVRSDARGGFDLLGSMLLFVLLGGVAALLSQIRGGLNWLVMLIGAIGLALVLVLFIWHERRHQNPVVNLNLFRHPAFSCASGGIALSNLS